MLTGLTVHASETQHTQLSDTGSIRRIPTSQDPNGYRDCAYRDPDYSALVLYICFSISNLSLSGCGDCLAFRTSGSNGSRPSPIQLFHFGWGSFRFPAMAAPANC